MILSNLRTSCQLSIWEELVDLTDLLHANTLQWVPNHTWLHSSLLLLLLLLHHLLLRHLLLVSHVSRHLLSRSARILLLLLHAHCILLEALGLPTVHSWLLLSIEAHLLLASATHYIALWITSGGLLLLHFNIIVF